MGPGGAPNRPLPPTPDEEENGDRTLVLRRVSVYFVFYINVCIIYYTFHKIGECYIVCSLSKYIFLELFKLRMGHLCQFF